MRSLIAAAVLLAAASGGNPQSPDVDKAPVDRTPRVERVQILTYGIFTGTVDKREDTPGTAIGTVNTLKDIKLVEQTETVKAKRGLRFGIEYVVVGEPKGKTVKLTWVTRFPPDGVVNAKGERFHENRFERDAVIGEKTQRTYSFDADWEMVPGDWALEFYYGDKMIGSKRFTVLPP